MKCRHIFSIFSTPYEFISYPRSFFVTQYPAAVKLKMFGFVSFAWEVFHPHGVFKTSVSSHYTLWLLVLWHCFLFGSFPGLCLCFQGFTFQHHHTFFCDSDWYLSKSQVSCSSFVVYSSHHLNWWCTKGNIKQCINHQMQNKLHCQSLPTLKASLRYPLVQGNGVGFFFFCFHPSCLLLSLF